MWEGNKIGSKYESESMLIDQLISLAREFKLDFHQYVSIIQQPDWFSILSTDSRLDIWIDSLTSWLMRVTYKALT